MGSTMHQGRLRNNSANNSEIIQGQMYQSYAAGFVTGSSLETRAQHPSRLRDGLAASTPGRGLKLRGVVCRKTSSQLLFFVKESAWSGAGVAGLRPDVRSRGYPHKHKILMPRCSLVVIDSSRHRDGRLLCQQPGESCSGMANPLGSRAVAGPERLMTQWSCGVVIAVEEVILFFNSLAQPLDRLDTGQGLSLGEVLTLKSFGAGRVVAVDSALELMVQKSFLLP